MGSILAIEADPKRRRLLTSLIREHVKSDITIVESVKAASDVYAPVSGEVVEGNAALADDPSLINRDPEGEGWFFKLKLDDPGEVEGLMDEGAYREWVKTL